MGAQATNTELPSMPPPVVSRNMQTIPITLPETQRAIPPFTHLESAVYNYLKDHAGTVCGKEQIKAVVWGQYAPSDSALQKIIERIRQKIELDPDHPHYLIAVRGQGFMLREDILGTMKE